MTPLGFGSTTQPNRNAVWLYGSLPNANAVLGSIRKTSAAVPKAVGCDVESPFLAVFCYPGLSQIGQLFTIQDPYRLAFEHYVEVLEEIVRKK